MGVLCGLGVRPCLAGGGGGLLGGVGCFLRAYKRTSLGAVLVYGVRYVGNLYRVRLQLLVTGLELGV